MKIIIKDNFLPDPEARRAIALNSDLDKAWDSDDEDFFDYVESHIQMNTAAINDQFSRIAGERIKLINTDRHTFNFYFQGAGVPTYVHHDDCDYIAIIYLSKNYGPEDGVSLYTHIPSGKQHHTSLLLGNSLGSDMETNADNYNPELWEKYMSVQAKFNRLVFFEPLYYHAASPGFGLTKEDCRLAEVMYFIKAENSHFSSDEAETGFELNAQS